MMWIRAYCCAGMLLGFACGVLAQEGEEDEQRRAVRQSALEQKAQLHGLPAAPTPAPERAPAPAVREPADEATEPPRDLEAVRQRIAVATHLLDRTNRELILTRAGLKYTDSDAAELREDLNSLEKLTLDARERLAHRLVALSKVNVVRSEREGLLEEVQELSKRERELRVD